MLGLFTPTVHIYITARRYRVTCRHLVPCTLHVLAATVHVTIALGGWWLVGVVGRQLFLLLFLMADEHQHGGNKTEEGRAARAARRRFWVTPRGRPHRGVELCVSHVHAEERTEQAKHRS